MKPIKFPEQNVTYAEDQPEYTPLPVFKNESSEGEVISCWSLSFKERLTVLFTGKMWLSIWTFNKGLSPTLITTKKLLYTPKK